jgi:anti-sigma B factor antagonist
LNVAPLVVRVQEPEWDYSSAERFGEILAPAATHPHVVIDLSSIEFLDSSCLGKLAALHRSRGPGGCVVVISSANIKRLFEIVQFDQLWPVFDSLEAALRNPALFDT